MMVIQIALAKSFEVRNALCGVKTENRRVEGVRIASVTQIGTIQPFYFVFTNRYIPL